MGKVENILAEMDAEYSRHKSKFNKTLRDLQDIKELRTDLKPINEAISDVREKIADVRKKASEEGMRSRERVGMAAVAVGLKPEDLEGREIEGLKERRKHLLELKKDKDEQIKRHEEKLKETILNKRGFIFMSAFSAGASEALESVRISKPNVEEISELHDKIVEEYNIGEAISKSKKNVKDEKQILGEIRNCNKDFIESLKLSSPARVREKKEGTMEEIQETFFNELRKAFFSGALCALECIVSHYPSGEKIDSVLWELEETL
jgi:DNA-binding TFAR19-related protein (PDSD5 family)